MQSLAVSEHWQEFREAGWQDREEAWAALKAADGHGVELRLSRRRDLAGSPEWLREARIRIDPVLEGVVREALCRPRPSLGVRQRWAALVHSPDYPFHDPGRVAALAFELTGWRDEDVLERLGRLPALALREPAPMLREVSSELFGGLSKLLDSRQELIHAVLGRQPFARHPVLLVCEVPTS